METSFGDDGWKRFSDTRTINQVAKDEELRVCYERIKMLEADLLECREYLEGHSDVIDGDYGEPAPNKAMRLISMIDESLYGPGGF